MFIKLIKFKNNGPERVGEYERRTDLKNKTYVDIVGTPKK